MQHGRDVHGDEGSTLILAVIVMMLMSTLALAGLARTLSTMAMVGHGQGYDSALAAADAGLNDVIYKLRTSTAPSTAGWTMPATAGAFEPVVGAPGRSYRYRTTEIAPGEYDVDVVGKKGDIAHGVRAKVTRGPAFSLFSDDELSIGTTGVSGLGLNLSAVLELGGASTEPIHIGSNTKISLASGASAGDFQHVYGANSTCQVNTTGACPNPVHHPVEYPLPEVEQPAGTDAADIAACDNMIGIGTMRGSFAGIVDGRAGDPYVCRRDVKLGALTVANGPLIIYVLDNSSGVASELDLSGALVNLGGRAADLRIYKDGGGRVLLNGLLPAVPVWPLTRLPGVPYLGDVTFTGYLYAPESILRINADQWWKGAMYAKRIEATGGNLITLTYDHGLDRIIRDWTVSRYAEIPSSEANV